MYKNQLQELAQRSCFNLPSYACRREGPDHAPRFKASVNFNGEIFESPVFVSTMRQAEHAAAEAALNSLSTRGSKSLTARVLDETGVYKNLLQETAHKAGIEMPVYTTVRSGPGHVPVFTCKVQVSGLTFTGDPAKTKKQAEKNAAMAAWSSLKKMPSMFPPTKKETKNHEGQDQVNVARVLSSFRTKTGKQVRRTDQTQKRKMYISSSKDNHSKYQRWWHLKQSLCHASEAQLQKEKSFLDLLPPPPPRTTSKILPLTSSREKPSDIATSFKPDPVPNRRESPVLEQNMSLFTQYYQGDKQESTESDAAKKSLLEEKGMLTTSTEVSNGINNGTSSQNKTHTGNVHFRPSTLPQVSPSPKKSPFPSTHMGIATQMAIYNPKKIAPAVHIRSVIPVCAAPPSPASVKASTLASDGNASSKPTVTTISNVNQSKLCCELNKLHLRGKSD